MDGEEVTDAGLINIVLLVFLVVISLVIIRA